MYVHKTRLLCTLVIVAEIVLVAVGIYILAEEKKKIDCSFF